MIINLFIFLADSRKSPDSVSNSDDYETHPCADYENEGYKCVPINDCEGLLSIRSTEIDYYDYEESSPTCSDPSQTCCPQEKMKKGKYYTDLTNKRVGPLLMSVGSCSFYRVSHIEMSVFKWF